MKYKKIALLAGGGSLPHEFLKAAVKEKTDVVILRVAGEAGTGFAKYGFKTYDINLTKLTDVIRKMKKEEVDKLIMLGYVRHSNLLKNIRFDLRSVKTLMKASDMRAVSIMTQVFKELDSEGITVIPSTYLMKDVLAAKGVVAGKKPSVKTSGDIKLGFEVAKKLSGMDVGQTVVIKNGNVIAVEAIEGTDDCIERGAKIAGKGFVVVKVSRPKQDLRYDVPVIGAKTIGLIAKYKGAGIAVEAGKTFVMDRDKITSIAKKDKIFITGI